MKFELLYANTTKVIVDVPDAELNAWLDGRQKKAATTTTTNTEKNRGAVVSATVKP
jgi:hypothetical protein